MIDVVQGDVVLGSFSDADEAQQFAVAASYGRPRETCDEHEVVLVDSETGEMFYYNGCGAWVSEV